MVKIYVHESKKGERNHRTNRLAPHEHDMGEINECTTGCGRLMSVQGGRERRRGGRGRRRDDVTVNRLLG